MAGAARHDLDTRGIAPAETVSRFLSHFDRLHPDDVLVVTTQRDPTPVLRLLEHERPGLFEWLPVEFTEGACRVEVSRRAAPGPRTVAAFMHAFDARLVQRLDALAAALAHLPRDAARAQLAQLLFAFRRRLTMDDLLWAKARVVRRARSLREESVPLVVAATAAFAREDDEAAQRALLLLRTAFSEHARLQAEELFHRVDSHEAHPRDVIAALLSVTCEEDEAAWPSNPS